MSRGKIKKLSTGVKSCSPQYSEILFTPKKQSIYKKNQKDARDRLRAYMDAIPQVFAYCGIRPPQTAPNDIYPFCRCRFEKREKNLSAAVGHCSVVNARQKKEVFLSPAFDNKNHTVLWIGG